MLFQPGELPPPSALPRPTKASMSPIREAGLAAAALPTPPVYPGRAASPRRQVDERPPPPVGIMPAYQMGVPHHHPPLPEVDVALRTLQDERDILSAALHEATSEYQKAQQEVAVLARRVNDEEAAHATCLRQGQESLAQVRASYEARLLEKDAETSELRQKLQAEREEHMQRMKSREEDHMGAIQAERQLGGERLGQMSQDTQDAVAIVQEQVADMQRLLEEERRASRETAERLMETQRRLQEAQDDNVKQKGVTAKLMEDFKVREQNLQAQGIAADEAGETHARERAMLKIAIGELEERILDLQRCLAQERQNREAAEMQCLRAEKIVQESAQSATASELRALESQKEAALKHLQLQSKQQQLSIEKEKRLVTESQLMSEASARHVVEERIRETLPAYPSFIPSQSPNVYQGYQSAAIHKSLVAASVRSASRQSMSLS